MTLLKLITDLQRKPYNYLEGCSPLLLECFLRGYAWVDESVNQPIWSIRDQIVGPKELDAFLRADLLVASPEEGFSQVLSLLRERLKLCSDWSAQPTKHAGRPPLEVLNDVALRACLTTLAQFLLDGLA